MPIEGKHHVENVDIEIDAYSFEINDGEIAILKGGNVKNSLAPENCHVCEVGSNLIIRCGRIDTETKWKCLNALITSQNALNLSWRLSVIQLEDPQFQWDKINEENRCLVFANERQPPHGNIVHLSIPLPFFYRLPTNPRILPAVKERLNNLPKLINMEALAQYCGWYHFDFKACYSKIMKNTPGEFRLEARISDFENEVESLFLKDRINDIFLIYELQEYLQDDSPENTLKRERDLVRLRQGIKSTLKTRYDLLAEIHSQIERIKIDNPALIPVGEQVLLLKTLLGSESDIPESRHRGWIEQFMIAHQLNRKLHVITAINCDNGGHRTNFAFAVALAISVLDTKVNTESLTELIVNWDVRSANFNKKIVLNGLTANLVKEEPLIVKLRFVFYKILKLTYLQGEPLQLTSEMIPDSSYLNLLPSHIYLSTGENIRIVEYNPETGIPISLTRRAKEKLISIYANEFS